MDGGAIAGLKIYFAGPDVFRPDIDEWKQEVRSACNGHGFHPLFPSDTEGSAVEIATSNLALIDQADVILANLVPFRGPEPDSGTVYEVGFGVAKGKLVIGYGAGLQTLAEKIAKHFGPIEVTRPTASAPWRLLDINGWGVEDNGSPVNLMLSETINILNGDVISAIQHLALGSKAKTLCQVGSCP